LSVCYPYPDPSGDDPRGFEWHHWWRLTHAGRATIPAPHGVCWRVTLDPRGTRIAAHARTGEVTVWDRDTRRRDRTVTVTFEGAPGVVAAERLAISPDGARLAPGEEGRLLLFATQDGRELGRLNLGSARMGSVAFQPDGRRIAVANFSNALWLWDPGE
jgi:WD40 repeat protein